MTALLNLLQSPLVWAFLIVGLVALAETLFRPYHRDHHFRRHPSGVWKCTGCPALRDRHGKELP